MVGSTHLLPYSTDADNNNVNEGGRPRIPVNFYKFESGPADRIIVMLSPRGGGSLAINNNSFKLETAYLIIGGLAGPNIDNDNSLCCTLYYCTGGVLVFQGCICVVNNQPVGWSEP